MNNSFNNRKRINHYSNANCRKNKKLDISKKKDKKKTNYLNNLNNNNNNNNN